MQATRILIVEHDERVCRVLGRIISRMGYTAFAAADYDSFKALYNEQVPAAILLNLEVAGNDNAEVCRYLVERKSPTAIILLSDMAETETTDLMELGLTAGLNMCGVLRKPVDVDSVKELLTKNLNDIQVINTRTLKKSPESALIERIINQAHSMKFDPDQRIEHRFCYIFGTKHKISNRTTELIPTLQLPGVIL